MSLHCGVTPSLPPPKFIGTRDREIYCFIALKIERARDFCRNSCIQRYILNNSWVLRLQVYRTRFILIQENSISRCRIPIPSADPLLSHPINNSLRPTTNFLMVQFYAIEIPYSPPPFTCMQLYTKPPVFQSGQVVSYISACTKLFGDKCIRVPTGGSAKNMGNMGIFRAKYGGIMGIFTIFPNFSCKNMGNMGISNQLSGFPRVFL